MLGRITLAFAGTFAVRRRRRGLLLLPVVTAYSVLLTLPVRRRCRLLVFPLSVTRDCTNLLARWRRLLDENVGAERQWSTYAIVMCASWLRFEFFGRALLVGLTLTVMVRTGRASFKLGIWMCMRQAEIAIVASTVLGANAISLCCRGGRFPV